MTVYYILYFLIGATHILVYGTKLADDRRRRYICLVSFWLLFLLFSLRHPSMGIDLGYGTGYGYIASFHSIGTFSWKEALLAPVMHYERGYILFNKLISVFTDSSQLFLACCAVAALLPFFGEICRESPYPALSVVLYMGLPSFLLLFSALRQAIAVGICFGALGLIRRKQPVRFFLVVFLAAIFHRSAWAFLPAYPIYHIPMNKGRRILSLVVIPAVYLLRKPLFDILKLFFNKNAAADDNNAVTLFAVLTLVYVFTILFSGEKGEIGGLKNLFFTACCIQALSGVYSTVMRVGYYYMNALVLLLPLVLYRMQNRKNAAIFRRIILVCFALFGLYSLRNSSWAMSNPYYWFWNR